MNMHHNILTESELEWSSVVANNAMNRSRKATGVNSYEKDVKLNPIAFLLNQNTSENTAWLDLCCGKGNALIEAANYFQAHHSAQNIKLYGIDLVDYFSEANDLTQLTLTAQNLAYWEAKRQYDLITIVHGLHYIGDKIGLLIKAAAALKKDGVLVANLDLKNIQFEHKIAAEKQIKAFFKTANIDYNSRAKLLKIVGTKVISNPFTYLGADDKAGANYTGQPVVNSIYRL